MKINDKDLYIKLPMEDKSFVTLPNSFDLSYNLFDRDDITDIGDYALYYLNNRQKVSITNFSLPSLTSITGRSALNCAFQFCTSLTSIDLSNLTSITGSNALSYAFQGCTSLTSVDLSSLTSITGSNALGETFFNCNNLTSVNLSSLTSITGSNALIYTFYKCPLTSLSFPSLNSNSFGIYTNQFNSMLQGVTGCTVHFPVSLQSVIGEWSDVTNGFGGTNTTVLFDLNGGRMAYTYVEKVYYSDDPEDYEYIVHTIYTADNTDVLQSPSVGDIMYTKSANNIYSSESTIKSIEGNKIYLNDRNVQNNYTISRSGTFDLFSITSIQLSLVGRPYASHTLIEYLDISGNVLSSSYISNAIYPISSWSSETKYIRVSPNTSASGYKGNWNMGVTTTSYKTYPEPFKRDASKDIINYVS